MSDDELTNDDVRQAIIGLRGGLPPQCDFCGKDTKPENLHPEEAGCWACIECIERWNKEDKEPKP
jgi:ribosomal protein L37AE/L43A